MKRARLWPAALALLCVAALRAEAPRDLRSEDTQTREARWAFFRGMNDAEGAKRYFEPLAKAGDAYAQWCMAQVEIYNISLPMQLGSSNAPKRAERWLRLAAEQGQPDAQYKLGVFLLEHGWQWDWWRTGPHSFGPYLRGNPLTDIKANEKEGLVWMHKAAYACNELALFWFYSWRSNEMPSHCPRLSWLPEPEPTKPTAKPATP